MFSFTHLKFLQHFVASLNVRVCYWPVWLHCSTNLTLPQSFTISLSNEIFLNAKYDYLTVGQCLLQFIGLFGRFGVLFQTIKALLYQQAMAASCS